MGENFDEWGIKLVKYTRTFLDLSLKWFNDDELRDLTQTPMFSREEQISWFNNLKYLNNYIIWGILVGSIPVGACGLKNIEESEGEYWGYIGDKNYRNKGIGTKVLVLVIKEALKMNINSLWLKVLPENIVARHVYEKSGFKIERLQDNLIIMRKIL